MAHKPEIIAEIDALSVHCRPPIMDTTIRAVWYRDWCDDLAEFPIESVRHAMRKWRHSGQTKFPTPGQLLPMVREVAPVEKGTTLQAWRTLSDDEYQALSLRDKIRHQTILAHEARLKAGPMFRNTTKPGEKSGRYSGVHLKPDDLSSTWRRWTEIADGHQAEAARLRKYLLQPTREAAE